MENSKIKRKLYDSFLKFNFKKYKNIYILNII